MAQPSGNDLQPSPRTRTLHVVDVSPMLDSVLMGQDGGFASVAGHDGGLSIHSTTVFPPCPWIAIIVAMSS